MIMTFTPFAPIPIYFIYKVATLGSKAFLPSDDWGPNKSIDNTGIPKDFRIRLSYFYKSWRINFMKMSLKCTY